MRLLIDKSFTYDVLYNGRTTAFILTKYMLPGAKTTKFDLAGIEFF